MATSALSRTKDLTLLTWQRFASASLNGVTPRQYAAESRHIAVSAPHPTYRSKRPRLRSITRIGPARAGVG
jgi:hypothetical protein